MSQNPGLNRNPDYYAARAVEERRLAMAASDTHARAAHLELAERYDALSEGREAPVNELAEDRQVG